MQPVKGQSEVRARGRPSRGVRDAILKAVRELIREQGVSAVTTAAIAQRAGASEASIHYHFGGKEQLLEEAIKTAIDSLGALASDISVASPESPDKSIMGVAAALEGVYDELIPLLVAVHGDLQLRQSIAPKLQLHNLGPHRAVSLVARHIASRRGVGGTASTTDDEAAALLVVGACFLRAWQRQMTTHRAHVLPALSRAVEALFDEESDRGRA